MSQRGSGYERQERDLYETPEWVTRALIEHLPRAMRVWEPAAGSGKMADVLYRSGMALDVYSTDIATGVDFLSCSNQNTVEAIITNPPYNIAQEFIEHALNLTRNARGYVAMLLRTDFDHAKTRQHLFRDCPQFACKVVLTKRIVWFDRPGAAPSFNHAWYIWDWRNSAPPVLRYNVQT